MAGRGKESAAVSKLGRNRKAQFTECVQGLVREQSGGHESYSCNAHHEHQVDNTHCPFFRTAVDVETSHEQNAVRPTNRPGLFSRFKRAIIQAVPTPKTTPQPVLERERSFKLFDFKKAEGAFPFKDVEGLFPSKNAQQTPISPLYKPYTKSARLSSMVLKNVAQSSQTVLIPQPSNAAVQKMNSYIGHDEMDKRMRDEMAEYKAKGASLCGITRNGRGTNRKRQPPKHFGPYRKLNIGLSKDPFIGPLQRSMSNAKKDLKRTLSRPLFTPPPPERSSEVSVSSGYLAQFWDCDSDVEVRSSRSTVEKENGNCALVLDE